jgi:hypothetical protein
MTEIVGTVPDCGASNAGDCPRPTISGRVPSRLGNCLPAYRQVSENRQAAASLAVPPACSAIARTDQSAGLASCTSAGQATAPAAVQAAVQTTNTTTAQTTSAATDIATGIATVATTDKAAGLAAGQATAAATVKAAAKAASLATAQAALPAPGPASGTTTSLATGQATALTPYPITSPAEGPMVEGTTLCQMWFVA